MSVPLEKLTKRNKSHPKQEPQWVLEGSPMPGGLRAWTAWVLLNRMWKPGGCRAAKKLNLKSVRKTRGRDSGRANEGEQLLKQQGGGLNPRRAHSPVDAGKDLPTEHPQPWVGAGVGSTQHPPVQWLAAPPAPMQAPEHLRYQPCPHASGCKTSPSAERTDYTSTRPGRSQYEARSFPPQEYWGFPDTLEQHEG